MSTVAESAKTVTVEISREMYDKYEQLGRKYNVPASRLIDQALRRAEVRRQVESNREKLRTSTRSLRDLKPVSMGKILKPWNSRAELLEDFFDRGGDDDRT